MSVTGKRQKEECSRQQELPVHMLTDGGEHNSVEGLKEVC